MQSQEKAKQAEIEELEGKILELKERLRDNAALYKKVMNGPGYLCHK